MNTDESLERVRQLCLRLPEATERLSHGAPTWFVQDKRTFVTYMDDHHRDGRLAIWCAAPAGVQQMLVNGDPVRFFVPPYVGHRGWLGARLDLRVDCDEIAELIEDGYRVVAPRGLIARLPRR